MVPKVDALKGLIKTATVSGIVLFWVNFRVEAFKMSWHIILTSPEEEETWKAVKKSCVKIAKNISLMTEIN